MRKVLKGWSVNIEATKNRQKQTLVAEYNCLDIMAETQPLSPASKKRMKNISGEL
mgnify:CR=1 FL=1